MLLSMAEVVRNRLRARINEILQQLALRNLDSDSQESVFFVETLYNPVVSVLSDNIITLWLNDRQQARFSNE